MGFATCYTKHMKNSQYFERIKKLSTHLGCTTDDFKHEIRNLYDSGMSAQEISEKLKEVAPVTARTILRWLKLTGEARDKKTAFNNAIKRGRVKWQLVENKNRNKKQVSQKTRYEVKERDGWRCVLCGASPKVDSGVCLEVDYIVPRNEGGSNNKENLRTLCHDCGVGRRAVNFNVHTGFTS